MENQTVEQNPERHRLEDSAWFPENRRPQPDDEFFQELDCCIIKKLHAEHERNKEEFGKRTVVEA